MSNTNPNDFKDLIAVFEEGLIFKIIEKQTVIAWADRIVTEDEHPDIFFIELCLMGSHIQEDIISYLRNILPEDYIGPARPLFALLYEKFKLGLLKLSELNRILYDICQLHFDHLTGIESKEIYDLQYKEAMVDNHSLTIDKVTQELLTFLEIYKEYTLENYLKWNLMDSKMDEKLASFVKSKPIIKP